MPLSVISGTEVGIPHCLISFLLLSYTSHIIVMKRSFCIMLIISVPQTKFFVCIAIMTVAQLSLRNITVIYVIIIFVHQRPPKLL